MENKLSIKNIYINKNKVFTKEGWDFSIVNIDTTTSFIISKKFVHASKFNKNQLSLGIVEDFEYNLRTINEGNVTKQRKIRGRDLTEFVAIKWTEVKNGRNKESK